MRLGGLEPREVVGERRVAAALTIYGTPRVPENEAAKIRRALARCEHSGKESA